MADKKSRKPIKFSKNENRKFFILICACAAAVILSFIVIAVILSFKNENEEKNEISPLKDVRGVWIATVGNIDFPSKPNLSESELKAELDEIVKTTSDTGLTSIYFQVRPASDALYRSDIFPVSKYLSDNGDLPLDTLEYLIKIAHEKNIQVHAWINPLRVATYGTLDSLDDKSPAKNHPDWCVTYADGKIYFDCGEPKVRQLISDGVREIVENYDVDGIIFDDYFYPYPVSLDDGTIAEFDDGNTYKKYGKDFDTVGDWRRDNVVKMVEQVYKTVNKKSKKCLFGIAPFGIWKNGTGEKDGSLTRGLQSYYDIYCDTVAFIENGYVDYIAPQIYWRTNEAAAPYDEVCKWWAKMTENTNVTLLISHAAYRYDEWENPEGTMREQVKYAKDFKAFGGSIYYGYDEIHRNLYGIKDEIISIYEK